MMHTGLILSLACLFIFAGPVLSSAVEPASVEMFSPQGLVKGVRQVSARFSEQIVAFGDPRPADPFDAQCPEKGRGRWVDGRTWVYDFERDMPAGITCDFRLKPDLRTLSGRPVAGQHLFNFSTGGPAVISSRPDDGAEIDEDQIFILGLDSEAAEASIEANVFCSVEGIDELIGVTVLKGEEKDNLLKNPAFRNYREMPVVALRCRLHFPNKAKVALTWGKGITSVSGISTSEDQVLTFRAREPFSAKFSCERENAKADCIPILPMQVSFTSPVSWDVARLVTLKVNNRTFRPEKSSRSGNGDEEEDVSPEDDKFVRHITFRGPFPENSSLVLEMPKGMKDDAGRNLANIGSFPLRVKTDAYPPLAKFSARFGIIELKGDAALPVTLRNLEPAVKTRSLKIEEKKEGILDKTKEGLLEKSAAAGESVMKVLPEAMKGKVQEHVEGLKGRLRNLRLEKEEKIIGWLRMVAAAERKTSILKGAGAVTEFSVPKPGGSKAFEVVGIPLKEPGMYIVEMESRILGSALLEKSGPMFVPAAALVTNLSAHFKWGRESSLVWVTTLDKAEPVRDASVSIRDCNGKQIWKGMTDRNGLAFIKTALPSEQKLPYCTGEINHMEASPALTGINGGLFVFARTKEDMTFVHSGWDNGIEPWRFNLPWASENDAVKAHTILDRSLLRAGDTLHMKHIIRKRTTSGFSMTAKAELPKTAVVYHQGSSQHYEFPLKWDSKGIAETTWKIPREARLGFYTVLLSKNKPNNKSATDVSADNEGEDESFSPEGIESANFRVEEFRVPLMKGSVQHSGGPLVKASEAEVDLMVTYLSGGGANNLPARLRSQVQPLRIHFDDYEDYLFANGEVKEGITKRTSDDEINAEGQTVDKSRFKVRSSDLTLDRGGNARAAIKDLPEISAPHEIMTELEFRDPNGEVQTVAAKIPLYPSGLLLGIKPDSWSASKDSLKFTVAALDLAGKPAVDVKISVDLFRKKYYSHRKRLVGGFYGYEHASEIKRVGQLCEGKTDARGLLICEAPAPVSGNVIIQAMAKDKAGNTSTAHHDIWVAGKGDWWFDVTDNDRMDLLPEKKRYEPGDTAKFQVRMPFREATALVTVEREGIIDTFIKKLSGKKPLIEIPVKGNYAPNVFVSVLCVRGRIEGQKTTALIDLGKPAYKLGIAGINVGWRNHELRVSVSADKNAYTVREKAKVRISVRRPDGRFPPKGSEAAVAAVDEGLLELMPNRSWLLLDSMLGKRGYELKTATAQMQVIGKRHYGLKAMPHGGGGGKQPTRELFDTLLYWKARVALDEKGEASVDIPLNDSLTGFRIVAVASGGTGFFGTGETGIRTTQDLILLSGLPMVVREGDRFRAGFTARNSSGRPMTLDIAATVNTGNGELNTITESLSAGEAREFGWEITVPHGVDSLSYEVSAKEKDGTAQDNLKIKQRVSEAVPVRTLQATIARIEDPLRLAVDKPSGAVAGKGGITLSFSPRISDGLTGVTRYMKRYPYTCLEQKVSRAIALRDKDIWKNIIAEIPAFLDADGFLKYFPSMTQGSDVLTSYILSISDEAGWEIPADIKKRMAEALLNFVEGKTSRQTSVAAADLTIRKLAATEALSRSGKAEPKLISSIAIEPNLWPTSALLDWMNILMRVREIPDRDKRFTEAGHILRSRINLQGTMMNLSTERTDNLWWLMVSGDLNAVRIPLTLLNYDLWKEEMPRIIRGALNRQQHGAWKTTTANAWGVLAFDRFSKKYESIAVTGITTAAINGKESTVDWKKSPNGRSIPAGFPKEKGDLTISHRGTGKPWVTVQSLAAVPLRDALSSGYSIKKTLIPVEQSNAGRWRRGDIARVRLELEAQADMTWVVLTDPIPAGANILGTGLGRDSQLLTKVDEKAVLTGPWPAFEERSQESFRAYYEYVPKGKWTVEYTVRLNNPGLFHLPDTRIEAMYAPEMFGEIPNGTFVVNP